MLDTPATSAYILLLAAVLVLAAVLIHLKRVLTSPLKVIPGPWLNCFSSLPYFHASAVLQQQAQYVHSLHKAYGSVVRLAPNEVSIARLDDVKTIHKIGSGFAKAPWYDYIAMTEANHGPPGLFQMRDFHEHAMRRKLLGRGFTVSSLRKDWEAMVKKKAMMAIAGIETYGAAHKERTVDVRKWWLIMASDVVSEVVFGRVFGGLETGKNSPLSEAISRANRINMLAMMAPWAYNFAKHIPIASLRPYFASHKELADIASIAVKNSQSDATERNVFSNILAQAGNGTLTDRQITIEAGNLISAGRDTTAETLTYLIWAVLSHTDIQSQLEEEVASIGDGMQDSELEKLPILNAVIRKTMRLYPASPFPQPRVVPKGGATFQAYFLPEGTVVSTSPWVTQRDPDVFAEPERFDHTRWLPNGSAINSEMARAAWWPFGAGSRVCLGRHLAMMEIRIATSLFFREFKGARLAPETTEQSMAMRNFVIGHPAAGECRVVLAEMEN